MSSWKIKTNGKCRDEHNDIVLLIIYDKNISICIILLGQLIFTTFVMKSIILYTMA